jgi:hypothetical protein
MKKLVILIMFTASLSFNAQVSAGAIYKGNPAELLKVNPEGIIAHVGDSVNLKDIYGGDYKKYEWNFSKDDVLSLKGETISASKPGDVVVTHTNPDGESASLLVKVVDAPGGLEVTVKSKNVESGALVDVTAKASYNVYPSDEYRLELTGCTFIDGKLKKTLMGEEITKPFQVVALDSNCKIDVYRYDDKKVSSVTFYALDIEKLRQALLTAINLRRTDADLKAFVVSEDLQAAANLRADELVSTYSHTRPNGQKWSTAIKEAGIVYECSAENIAQGKFSANDLVKAWMDSNVHRSNITNSKMIYTGIGLALAPNGDISCVQLFTD